MWLIILKIAGLICYQSPDRPSLDDKKIWNASQIYSIKSSKSFPVYVVNKMQTVEKYEDNIHVIISLN